ncbi:MAG TPA: indole-3-glycerol phosphate synthase TrpC [Parasegetibacter sp.]
MNILDKIVATKKLEVEEAKRRVSEEQLRDSNSFFRTCFSLKDSLLNPSGTGIIAEFKRASPSKGRFNASADVLEVTTAYTRFGASGLSVLTDEKYFCGSSEDLKKARTNEIPILRKDFIIDSYQILEAKSIGADVILLIAACLSPLQVQEFTSIARSIGMEVLLELHSEEELGHIGTENNLIGINNRDLKTFRVDVQRSIELSRQIPDEKLKIAESGITDVDVIRLLKKNGFHGFLIGENFMKHANPGESFNRFAEELINNQLL